MTCLRNIRNRAGRLELGLSLSPALLFAHPVSAHAPAPGTVQEAFFLYMLDPLSLLVLVIIGGCYARGTYALKKVLKQRASLASSTGRRRRDLCFWLGWVSLCIALLSPIDRLGEALFSVHMLQHELMIIVAAPLLVISKPMGVWLWGLPRRLADACVSVLHKPRLRQLWLFISSAGVAWLIYAITLWGWHLPFLFEASLHSYWIHTLQHLSFLLAALIFWWPLVHSGAWNNLLGCLYIFTTTIHSSLLGAALTFSPFIWYPSYLTRTEQWGIDPLVDQQLGGLIMWLPAGFVLICVGLLQLARGLKSTETRSAYLSTTLSLETSDHEKSS